MKVISLLQPWATLVVIGAKKIETRSWNTSFRGPLAIHASKKFSRAQAELCRQEPFKTVLNDSEELPLGAIIGSVFLEDIFHTELVGLVIYLKWLRDIAPGYGMEGTELFVWLPSAVAQDARKVYDQEIAFGDYSAGRYGWALASPVAFRTPVPARGSLGLWEYPICKKCGCTDDDCRHCIEKTGHPCHWVEDDLCSACVEAPEGTITITK